MLRVLALLLFFSHAALAVETESCPKSFAPLASAARSPAAPAKTKTLVVKLTNIQKADPEKRKYFLGQLAARAERLDSLSKKIAEKSLARATKYYEQIAAQTPKEGYARALSIDELKNILREGGLGSGHDFNFANAGARVGHNGNFLVILCRKCTSAQFFDGGLGSSVVNKTKISLDDLEIVIPSIPDLAP